MTQSALLIAVPEAESVVGRWRERFDRAAEWGVPAHITLLYPFAPPGAIEDGMIVQLRTLFAATPTFDFALESVQWFGENVVFLAPNPAEPFRALTDAIAEQFPDYPPYGGAYDDVVPHLTVGDGAPVAALREAADAVTRHLPVGSTAREVVLMTGSDTPRSWRIRDRFPLRTAIA